MRLEKIEIELFRNFTDAQEMTVEPAVTSLVGKNESGKTTILQALHRLNPANNPDTFTLSTEYPRPRLARDRRKRSLEEVTPVTAWFSLEPSETPQVAEILGFPPPDGTLVEASRSYDDTLRVEVTCPVGSVVRVAGEAVGVNAGDLDELSDLGTVPEVTARAREMAAAHRNVGETAQATALEKLPRQMDKYEVLFDVGTTEQQEGALIELLPKFFYFSDYQMLAGETNLNELAERVASGQLRDGDETMISLLSLAGQEPKSFLDEEYVTRKAELQAASSDLTRQVMKYWKQNDALSVVFDTDMPVVGANPAWPRDPAPVPQSGTARRPPRRDHELLHPLSRVPVVLLVPGRLQRLSGLRRAGRGAARRAGNQPARRGPA